jgi:hypothetical protein
MPPPMSFISSERRFLRSAQGGMNPHRKSSLILAGAGSHPAYSLVGRTRRQPCGRHSCWPGRCSGRSSHTTAAVVGTLQLEISGDTRRQPAGPRLTCGGRPCVLKLASCWGTPAPHHPKHPFHDPSPKHPAHGHKEPPHEPNQQRVCRYNLEHE